MILMTMMILKIEQGRNLVYGMNPMITILFMKQPMVSSIILLIMPILVIIMLTCISRLLIQMIWMVCVRILIQKIAINKPMNGFIQKEVQQHSIILI